MPKQTYNQIGIFNCHGNIFEIQNIAFKKDILANHLSILLFKTKELLQSHQVNIKSSSRSMELFNQFKMILNDNFKNLLEAKAYKIVSIKEIANQLNVHPNYLSNVIKEETCKSASDWIHDRTSSETQSLLKTVLKLFRKLPMLLVLQTAPIFLNFLKK